MPRPKLSILQVKALRRFQAHMDKLPQAEGWLYPDFHLTGLTLGTVSSLVKRGLLDVNERPFYATSYRINDAGKKALAELDEPKP